MLDFVKKFDLDYTNCVESKSHEITDIREDLAIETCIESENIYNGLWKCL